jgi:hypothetical protein
MVAQGVSLPRARSIANFAFSTAAQAGAPLEPELRRPIPPTLTLLGSRSVLDAETYYAQLAIDRGLSGNELQKFVAQRLARNLPLRDLETITVGQPTLAATSPTSAPSASGGSPSDVWPSYQPSPQPIDTTLPNPQPGALAGRPPIIDPNCQSSYSFDPNTNSWTPTPFCGVVPAGYVYDPTNGVATPGNPPADEIQAATQDLAYALSGISYNLKAATAAMQNAAITSTPGTDQNDCCEPVVAALQSIAAALSTQPPPAPETAGAPAPVAPAVDSSADLASIASSQQTIAKMVESIANCICATRAVKPEDRDALLERIAKALESTATSIGSLDQKYDVPQNIIDQMAADRIFPQSVAQLLVGAPPEHVEPTVKAYERDSTWLRFYNEVGHYWNVLLNALGLPSDPNYLSGVGYRDYHMKPIIDAGEKAAEAVFSTVFDVTGAVAKPVTDALLNVHSHLIAELHDVQPGDENDAASKLLDEAIGAGVGAHLAAVSAEMIFPTKNLGFGQLAALMAELAGFREIMAGIIGPEVKQAVSTPHTYKVNATARAVQPDLATASDLHARRLISDADYATLAGYQGITRKYENTIRDAARRGINARQLLRVLDFGILSDAEIRDELQYAGLRDASIDRMVRAARALAVIPYQQKALATATQAYERGAIQEAELDDLIAHMYIPDGADEYIKLDAHYRKLLQLTDLFEKSVSAAYEFGQLSDADYISQLEAAGIAPADAQARYALDSSKLRGKAAAREARAEQKFVDENRRRQVEVAKQQYLSGNIDAAALAALLAAAGEPPNLVEADVQLTELRRNAKRVHVYNLALDRTAANLLRAEVSALEEQTIKGLLDPEQARARLEALGLNSNWAQALSAKWAAQKFKILEPV